MTYPRLARFIAPARARAELWRTLLGLTGVVVLYYSALFVATAFLVATLGDGRLMALLRTVVGGSTPFGLSLTLASFLPMAAAVIFVARALHARRLVTLTGTGAGAVLRRVIGPLLGLQIALLVLQLGGPDIGRATPLATLLRWLPLAGSLLFLQVAAEELVFRGYLLQQMAARFQSRLAWMILPSALFGALHYDTASFGPAAIFPALWAGVFGCLAADLTARTGNLGAALALHFATNIGAIFLVGLYGNLDGLALYTLVLNTRDMAAIAPYMACDFALLLVNWLMIRVLLRV